MSERRRYRADGKRLVEGFDAETGKLTEWLTRDAAIWWAGDGCELLEGSDSDQNRLRRYLNTRTDTAR